MATERPRIALVDLLIAGALPAASLGLLEAAVLLWGFGARPALDLGTLSFAVLAYAAAGALLSLLLYWPLRWLGARLGWELLPWHGRPSGSAGLAGAWALAQALLWLVIVAGTFPSTYQRLPLTSWQGLAGLAGSGVLAYLLGWFLVPAAAARTGGNGRRRRAGGLLAVLALGLLLPPLLRAAVYDYAQIPARTAQRFTARDASLDLPAVVESGPPSVRLPDVVLITLDTTRADHLSAYGYARDTSPRLEEFAREAVRFDSAWSASSWTVPAHASLFTGLFPHSHGAHYMNEAEIAEEGDYTSATFKAKIRPLDPAHRTLAEVLAAHGYRTGAFVGGPYMYAEFGMAQGFAWYDDRFTVSVAPQLALYRWLDGRLLRFQPDWLRFDGGYRWGDRINASVFDWLAAAPLQRCFLFVNYFDAHEPYTPLAAYRDRYDASGRRVGEDEQKAAFAEVMSGRRPPRAEEMAWLASQYDAELRYQDEQLGRLFDFLKAQGRYDQALIIVTADHGESLGEHGEFSHGFSLYAPTTRIPLLVKFPQADAVAAGVRDYAVHQVDVLPTILARLQIGPEILGDQKLQGRHLLDDGAPHAVLSELERDDWKVDRFGARWSRDLHVWTERGHRVHELAPVDEHGRASAPALLQPFDLSADPLELQPLPAAAGVDAGRRMRAWLEAAPRYLASTWMRDWMQAIDRSSTAGALGETGYADGASEASE